MKFFKTVVLIGPFPRVEASHWSLTVHMVPDATAETPERGGGDCQREGRAGGVSALDQTPAGATGCTGSGGCFLEAEVLLRA